MNFLILASPNNSEFYYQALDYYRLLDGFLEPPVSAKSGDYIKNPKTMALDKVRNFTILAFRPLVFDEIRTIHDDNRIVYFNEDEPHPSIAITGNAMHSFVTFGHRTAYKLANYLSAVGVDKPVYRVMPWVDVTGIKTYDKPPLGKVSGNSDMGVRPMLRLMASGAIAVVPNCSPFTDVIINGWNGVVCNEQQPDFMKIGHSIKSSMADISKRSKEFAQVVTDKSRYTNEFNDVIVGMTFDYNEPWINIRQTMGSEWVIPKESIENGVTIQVPKSHSDRFKIMKPVGLEQLLDIFTNMRFKRVFVFDSIVEEINDANVGRINRSLNILGDRSRNILFCFDQPDKWKAVSHKLTFIQPSEAEKQVV